MPPRAWRSGVSFPRRSAAWAALRNLRQTGLLKAGLWRVFSYSYVDNVWQRSALFSRFAVCYKLLNLSSIFLTNEVSGKLTVIIKWGKNLLVSLFFIPSFET